MTCTFIRLLMKLYKSQHSLVNAATVDRKEQVCLLASAYVCSPHELDLDLLAEVGFQLNQEFLHSSQVGGLSGRPIGHFLNLESGKKEAMFISK